MLTFFSLLAIVLLFKFVFFLHWFFLSRPFAPVSAEIFKTRLYVHVFQITSCIHTNKNRYKYRDQKFDTLAFFPMFF